MPASGDASRLPAATPLGQPQIAVLERQLDAGDRRITPAILTQFGDLLQRKPRGPDPKVRREYVQLLVDRVEVGNHEIRVSGRNSSLERAVIASQAPRGLGAQS